MPDSLHKSANGHTIADELRQTLRRLVIATVVLFALMITLGVVGWYSNHQQSTKNADLIADLAHSKVSISQLERSNCRVKKFLLTSVKFRKRIARMETDGKKLEDLRAARTSSKLAAAEANEACPNEHPNR